jgi:hypothetical protein
VDPLAVPDDWGDLADLFPTPPECRLFPPPTGVLPPDTRATPADVLRLTDPVEELARLFAGLDE